MGWRTLQNPRKVLLRSLSRRRAPIFLARCRLVSVKIQIRLRACRRPSVFSPAKFAPSPNPRGVLMSFLQGADPLGGPKGSQGNPRGAQGAQGDPREPKGIQGNPRKTQRDPKGPKGAFGALAGVGQWGPLGYSEAIPNGKLFRVEGYYEWKATPK